MSSKSTKYCEYCHTYIAEGQMWVRQRIHSPSSCGQPSEYLYLHADPHPGDTESCWEKFEIKRELLVVK